MDPEYPNQQNADHDTESDSEEDGDSAQPRLRSDMKMMAGKVPAHQPGACFRLLTDAPGQQQTEKQTVNENDAVCEHHYPLPIV
jgi:hypothetical protein